MEFLGCTDAPMKITILAFSSSGGSYPVEFSDETGALRVFCHCQAGQMQQMCKHKLALLRGDKKMLYDPSQGEMLDRILASATYLPVKARLGEYELALAAIEREMAGLKVRERNLKAEFAYELAQGHKRKK